MYSIEYCAGIPGQTGAPNCSGVTYSGGMTMLTPDRGDLLTVFRGTTWNTWPFPQCATVPRNTGRQLKVHNVTLNKVLRLSSLLGFVVAVCSCGSEVSGSRSDSDKTASTDDGAMAESGDAANSDGQPSARGEADDSTAGQEGTGDPDDFLDAVRAGQGGPAPNPPETGPATPRDEEGMTQTDEAWGQGEGAGATGSEPEAHYDSCDECRAAMCSTSWEVCQAEPLCTSGLGCLGGECGASGSLECASACFDDDLELALVAFQLYACSELQCPVECG